MLSLMNMIPFSVDNGHFVEWISKDRGRVDECEQVLAVGRTEEVMELDNVGWFWIRAISLGQGVSLAISSSRVVESRKI